VIFFIPPSVSAETSDKIDEFEKNKNGRRHNNSGLVFRMLILQQTCKLTLFSTIPIVKNKVFKVL
jgi:hypothetical protein